MMEEKLFGKEQGPETPDEQKFQVFGVYFWGDGPCDYSEGLFYTLNQDVSQEYKCTEIRSNGTHVGSFTAKEGIETIKRHILKIYEKDKFERVIVNVYTPRVFDRKFTHSGPPTDWMSEYIVKGGELVLKSGQNVLSL